MIRLIILLFSAITLLFPITFYKFFNTSQAHEHRFTGNFTVIYPISVELHDPFDFGFAHVVFFFLVFAVVYPVFISIYKSTIIYSTFINSNHSRAPPYLS